MGISIRGVGLGLLAGLVVAPLAAFSWQASTGDHTVDRVLVSLDGVRWSADVEEPFFYSQVPWEPGEARTAILWLRNDAGEPADVTITVNRTAGEELVEDGALVVSASVDDRPEQTFDAEEDTNLVHVGRLEPDESATLTLRAQAAGDSTDAPVVDSLGIRYHVSGSGRAVEGSSPSVLAADNARLVLAPVFLGVALIVTAVVMYSTRRSPGPRDSARH